MVEDEVVIFLVNALAYLEGVERLSHGANFFAFAGLNTGAELTVELFAFFAILGTLSPLDAAFVSTERTEAVTKDKVVIILADALAYLEGVQSLAFGTELSALAGLDTSTKLIAEFLTKFALFRAGGSLDVSLVATEGSKVVVVKNFVKLRS